MKIKTLVLGDYEVNCYILEKDNKIIIIDPGYEANRIINELKDKKIEGIIVTHNHFDHIGALEKLKEQYKIIENDYQNIKSFDFEVINTPGHSSDSKTFYFKKENIMFCGDFIFNGTIGRMDLPTGSAKQMKESLEKIRNYNDDIIIYPGHGPKTILGIEKENFDYYKL